MSFNRITDIDIISLSEKDFLSFISKKNQIHEEIKDYVINRFIKKIYEQNKEIEELKRKLEEIIKSSLLIIKRNLLKKKYFPVNQIRLSYNKSTRKNKTNNINYIINSIKDNNQKSHKNNAKSFASFNKINLKKYLKPKTSINNKLYKYNQSLDFSGSYRNNSRNIFNKDSTSFSERQYNTFFYENNNKIEPINSHSLKRNIKMNSLDKKEGLKKTILNENKINKIYLQNSFFCENQNKIILLNQKLNNKVIKKNKTRNLNCLKKLDLSNIIINKNPNLSNNILDYCMTERPTKNRETIKEIIGLKKNNFTCPHNGNNININYVNNINQNSVPKKKKIGKNKLNKIILKMKEINKNLNPKDFQNIIQKSTKARKKINISDINKNNTLNYISMTDRLLDNKNNNVMIREENVKVENNINSSLKNEKLNNINEYKNNKDENSFQTIYNPTFTSFLNRKNNNNQN